MWLSNSKIAKSLPLLKNSTPIRRVPMIYCMWGITSLLCARACDQGFAKEAKVVVPEDSKILYRRNDFILS
jgi:hypothetical protein